MSLDKVDSLEEDSEQGIFFYNHAVILYHVRQYKKALHILDRLFKYIEPMGQSHSLS